MTTKFFAVDAHLQRTAPQRARGYTSQIYYNVTFQAQGFTPFSMTMRQQRYEEMKNAGLYLEAIVTETRSRGSFWAQFQAQAGLRQGFDLLVRSYSRPMPAQKVQVQCTSRTSRRGLHEFEFQVEGNERFALSFEEVPPGFRVGIWFNALLRVDGSLMLAVGPSAPELAD